MGQNLKKLFEKDRLVNHPRRKDHEDLFIERLYTELPVKKRNTFEIFKIAASILLFVALGTTSYLLINPINQDKKTIQSEFILSAISPELEEIEDFYITNINLTLLEVQDNKEGKSIFNRYMNRFSILKREYKKLVIEINEEGPNTRSINALINNLKMQLELLQTLKTEMIPLNNKEHETI